MKSIPIAPMNNPLLPIISFFGAALLCLGILLGIEAFRKKPAPSHSTINQPTNVVPYIANSVATNPPPVISGPAKTLYAVLVSTNLVPQNCSCGVCDPSRNIAVPEHINSIGHDLRIEVSTNYLPLVTK